jgi:aminopeptidase N
MRFLAVAVVAACGGPGPSGPITAHVEHYDYRFDIDSRVAHATLTARVEIAGDCLTLPFRAEGFDAATAKVDGEAAGGQLAGSELTLCGDGHDEGDAMTLDVDMTIPMKTLSTSQVGYSIATDFDGNPFYYLVSWVDGCDQFGPCDSRPDQFATYTFHVTHPAGFLVKCPGTITEVSATETECDFGFEGGPTYSTFGVAAYPAAAWPMTDKGMWGSVHAVVYDRPTTGVAAAIDGAYHAQFIAFMESTFGPFPYGNELRVLTAPTYWDGFEHPGNIVLREGIAKSKSSYLDPVAHVLDHEMAHQWAGDQTTLAGTYDFVWKEAMAEYLAFVHEDMTDPVVSRATANAWRSFAQSAQHFPVPDDKPALFDYYGDAYGPGPMILFRQLEVLSSREQVIAGLKSVLGKPRALSVDDLVDVLAEATGLGFSLDDYAQAWLHGSGAPDWPRMMVTFTRATGTSTLAVKQVNPSMMRCKFHVALQGANAGEQVLVEVDTFRNGIDQAISVPTPAFAVTSTILDPLRECLVYGAALQAVAPDHKHPWRSASQ